MFVRSLGLSCSFLSSLLIVVTGARAAEVRHAAPEPAETLTIPDVVPALPTKVSFQSKLSTDSYNLIDGYLWKPVGASAQAKVPLVIVAHGHTGMFYCGSNAAYAVEVSGNCNVTIQSQYTSLARELTAAGIGMMLVNSFTPARNDRILQLHVNQTGWDIYPLGLNEDKTKRDPLISDHASRPYDLAGAAAAVATVAPWANSTKLVALGYSHGGSAAMALALSNHPVNTSPLNGGRQFLRIFATYPGCALGGTNTYYKASAAVTPLSIGTGSADTSVPPGTMPGTPSDKGACRERYEAAKTAAVAGSGLFKIDWWNYTGATHSWETAQGPENEAARAHWRAKVIAYAVSVK
ncbi:hypothetical protein [Prosthecodimorpha staleyi]|uniref:Chlorophyllase n=1 Tax=Prosthecodimorpha staleyi TaxID=2840188 RepID=A0A947GBQ9_9HYPH|nr:hypothetical protein [Prosthecodimorpha staleyi]MBT9288947.1 hypothetical protein [Prosthecodimorpha staleyi]